jgi:hypothetical protein
VIDLHPESAMRGFRGQIDGAASNGFLVVVADDDDDGPAPLRAQTFEDLAQNGIRGPALLGYALASRAIHMPRRIHFIELHEDEIRPGEFRGFEGRQNPAIRSIAQSAAGSVLGQLAPGRPVFVGSTGTAGAHEILIPEERKASTPRGATAIE